MTRYRDNRRALLASVHIARKDLGLTDDEYRGALEAVTGKRSAGDLKIAELVKICGHFEKLGWGRKQKSEVRSQKSGDGRHEADGVCLGDPRSRIQGRPGTERLLGKLRRLSEAMSRPWPGYVEAILKKQGIDRLEWAYPEDLRRVVASMEYQRKREAA